MRSSKIFLLLAASILLLKLPKEASGEIDDGRNREWFDAKRGRNVMVHMSDQSTKSGRRDQTAHKVISVCVECPDPSSEGSIVTGLLNYHNVFPEESKLEFDFTSEIVWAIPNYVDHKKLLNAEQLKNRVALVKRGRISLFDKVEKIMLRSDAIAVVVVDDGQCDEQFRWCGPRAGNVGTGGWAAYDDEDFWDGLNIPVVMVTAAAGQRLNQMMTVREVDVLGMDEPQHMTILNPNHKPSISASTSGNKGGSSPFDSQAADYDGYGYDGYYYYEDEL